MLRLRSVSAAAAAVVALSGLVSPVATVALASGAEEETCVDDPGQEAPVSANARMADGSRSGALDHRDVSAAEAAALEKETRQRLAQKGGPKSGEIVIPTYVHVMTSSTGEGNVSDRQIRQQIAVLNKTYGGLESSAAADTPFTFELAGVQRIPNDNWHLDRESNRYRSQTRLGGADALNIWLVDFAYLGIATFPWDYEKQPAVDGIRVHYGSLPGGILKYYDEGKTATHEVGHWLGLYHVFQGGCRGDGDFVSDTPPQGTPSYECPIGKDSCAGDGPDSVTNYMDYSDDFCYDRFTPDQSVRMSEQWTAWRTTS